MARSCRRCYLDWIGLLVWRQRSNWTMHSNEAGGLCSWEPFYFQPWMLPFGICNKSAKGHLENNENDCGLLSFSLFVEPKLALRSSRFSWMHLVQAVMPGHGHHDPVHLGWNWSLGWSKKMVYKVYNFICMDLWNACGCWASSLANLQWTTLWHDPCPVRSIVQAVESSPETLLWRWNVARRTLLWGCSKAMRSPQSSCDDYDVSMRSQTSRILIDDVSICISQCQFCKLFPSKFLHFCVLACFNVDRPFLQYLLYRRVSLLHM